MIKISHETPISLFKQSLEWNDYQYCLVHLLEEQPKYLEHFRMCRDKGVPVILDNSIFELGTAFEAKKFAKWIEELKPDEYIIPDVLEDSQGTIESLHKWMVIYGHLPGKKIGVVQGKTYEEIIECYREVDKFCDKIAISFNYSLYEHLAPSGSNLISWCIGRQVLLNKLLEDGVINISKPHHLLGIALPQEVKYYSLFSERFSWIESLDTSNPIVHGLLGIKYSDEGLETKSSIKLFELITSEIENLDIIEYNISKFAEFLGVTRDLTYEQKISKSLGSANSYSIDTDKYDSSLLNPIPRDVARRGWNITGNEFVGIDVWHCHEATFLTDSGIPVAGTLKFSYPSTTKDMVESKSMKLYLNSFDMCKMGKTIRLASDNYVNTIKSDLSRVLDTEVSVHFHFSGAECMDDTFSDYTDLHPLVWDDEDSIHITDYKGKDKHILPVYVNTNSTVIKLSTNVLRSRCRHTKQKDTGTAFIYIKTVKGGIDPISVFKEVVSLRDVEEFHEFCAEKLYTSIMSCELVEQCMVSLLYSRRGSLDINPIRATSNSLLDTVSSFTDTSNYSKKTQGQ